MLCNKKIYFIDKSLDGMGGIERVINTLANNLSDNYDVEVISYFKNRDKPFFEYRQNVKFSTILGNMKLKSSKYRNKRVLYFILRFFEKGWDYLRSLHSIRYYTKKISKNDIVVFGRVEMALKFSPYISKAKKIIVREASHLYNHKDKRKLKKIFTEKVDTFIVSSDENAKKYNDFFEGKIDIKKIYNPLGINPVDKINFDAKTVVSVGRYDLQKGFDVLIRSWNIVSKKHPDWKLRILGDGFYKNDMISLINDFCLQDKIELVPNTPDVVSELQQSSIFVMASRIEGYANALVEAMACGLACVSFDWVMGVEDIINDNKNGIIVPLNDRLKYMNYNYWNQEDVESLATAICKLIENKQLRVKLGNNARLIIDSREQGKIIEQWENNILK